MDAWAERAQRASARHDDALSRLPGAADERQRQLTRAGNAAWAAGLSLLMTGRRDDGIEWLLRAADRYRESWPNAPPGSWGRPIAAMKARLIAGDFDGASADAEWALGAGAEASESPIGRYAATLAALVLGRDAEAELLAEGLSGRDDFPAPVAESLVGLARGDADGYARAVRDLVADFEARDELLEDVPVADTVLALQALAGERSLRADLDSPMLPR